MYSPLDTDFHCESSESNGILNIVTGQIYTTDVNVDNSKEIGSNFFTQFKANLTESFHNPIPNMVNTMAVSKKRVKVGNTNVVDPDVIYSRAMILHLSGTDVDIDNIMTYELAPVINDPTSS